RPNTEARDHPTDASNLCYRNSRPTASVLASAQKGAANHRARNTNYRKRLSAASQEHEGRAPRENPEWFRRDSTHSLRREPKAQLVRQLPSVAPSVESD